MTKTNRHHKKNRNPVPLLIIIVGLALILVAGVGSRFLKNRPLPPAEIEVSGKPSLTVDKEMIDFGKVPFDQPVEAKFILTNVGDQTLTFTSAPYIEVAAGC